MLAALLGACRPSAERARAIPARAPLSSPPLSSPPRRPQTPREDELAPIGQRAPEFERLPGESDRRSLSVGDVTSGFLVDGVTFAWPQPALAPLAQQRGRAIAHTSSEMRELLSDAADFVARRHPGAVVYLGNMSASGGGDIPYSVSHNSGRDADIAFLVTDADAKPAATPSLLPLDEQGRYEGEEGIFLFDVERNWALIEGLITSPAARIQYIFVADWLRDALITYALEHDAPVEAVELASAAMRQPSAGLAHNDHFHIRLYCAARDARAGCVDTGRAQPGWRRPTAEVREARSEAARALKQADDPFARLAGASRLAWIGRAADRGALSEALADPSPPVRAAAARALARIEAGSGALAERLVSEPDPRVAAELIHALAERGDRTSLGALAAYLGEPRGALLHGEERDLRLVAVDALSTVESKRPVDALIALLERPTEDARLLARAEHALSMLTNFDVVDRWDELDAAQRAAAAEQWRSWYAENRKKSRRRWVLDGFERAGFGVRSIRGREVWTICRAIEGPAHISYNARRALMRLSKNENESVSWSVADASFYWRRWFERRRRRFGAPPIPDELATLTEKE